MRALFECSISLFRGQGGSNQSLWNWYLFCFSTACSIKEKEQRLVGSQSGCCVWLERHVYPWTFVTLEQSRHHYHLIKCNLFSPWYSWKNAHLALNNNHSLTHLKRKVIILVAYVPLVAFFTIHIYKLIHIPVFLKLQLVVFNATFNKISAFLWRSVLLVEETGVLRENHRPAVSYWQTLSHNVLSSTPHLSGVRTRNVSGDRHWLHR